MLEPLPTLRARQKPVAIFARGLPARTAFDWLAAGWSDLRTNPLPSLAFGVFLTLLSYVTLWILGAAGLLYLALPAVAGFLIIGPFIALGLYEKSRLLEQDKPVSLGRMLLVRPASKGQLAYAGLLLALLVLFWLRAADLLYALFFGLTPFPGAADAFTNVLTTGRGWALILVGGGVGGLFAGFAFALSLFSIPMLLSQKSDALTSLGTSFAMTFQNLPVTLTWGTIVACGLLLSVATGLLGLVIVFPVLGHGTWHAYKAIWRGGE